MLEQTHSFSLTADLYISGSKGCETVAAGFADMMYNLACLLKSQVSLHDISTDLFEINMKIV